MSPSPRPPEGVNNAALASDDVLLSREAERLGLSPWHVRRLAAIGREQGLPRGTIAVPPFRDLLRARARAALLLVPDGIVCGITAARLHGLEGLNWHTPAEPVHLLLPATRTRWQRSGLRLHWSRRPIDDPQDLEGLRVTSVENTLLDLRGRVDRTTFVSLADSAVRKGLIDDVWLARQQQDEADEPAGWWHLVDGRSESPSETAVRLVLTDGGLPPDELQIRVRDDTGRIIARLDMGWKRPRVGLEVDSTEHDKPTPLYRDRYRQNDLFDLGWDIRRVTGWDARNRPAYVLRTVRNALEQAA